MTKWAEAMLRYRLENEGPMGGVILPTRSVKPRKSLLESLAKAGYSPKEK